jgi:hypothetical protein
LALPLAVAVRGRLYLGRAGLDREEGVGHRTARVVVAVDAQRSAGTGHRGHAVGDLLGQGAAIGVAEHDDLRSRIDGGVHECGRVVAVELEAIEEVLGVDHDPAPLPGQVPHGVAQHGEVLLARGAQRQLDVTAVTLGDQGHDGGPGVQERAHLRVFGHREVGPAGRPERHQLRVTQRQVRLRALEECSVHRDRPRPAAHD